MPAAIDRGDKKGIGEAIERQRPRQRNDMPAIDQPPSETALALDELVEMNARGILIKPRRDLVLGFLDRHAVDMVNSLADFIIAEAIRAASEREVVSGDIDRRARFAQQL